MKLLSVIIVSILLLSCNVFKNLRETDWTMEEIREWSLRNKNTSTWKGMILYQGSDSLKHHFIGRWMDEWTWFNISKVELELEELYPFDKDSRKNLGYYYVDPNQGFKKIADYQ